MKSVVVYLDGEERIVPEQVYSREDARTALRVPPGWAVAYESDKTAILCFEEGHSFTEGDRYAKVSFGDIYFKNEKQEPESDTWERDADWWKDDDA